MKAILVTDSHLGINQSSDLYHDIVFRLFKEISEYCAKTGIRRVIHLGDFFHERKVLNTKTQHVAHKIADLFEDVALVDLIVGNHDIYYKDNLVPTALEIFKNYHHMKIIDKITEIEDDIVLCPWGQMPVGYMGGYCMGHFELIGFKMNNHYMCERGQDPDELMYNDFKHTYSGHFHHPSTRNSITYLGSPYPQTFHDVDSKRGYYIWESGKLEFIEFTYAPKFIKMSTDSIDNNLVPNNIIKLIFTEDYGSIKNQQVVDEVMAFNPIKLQVDFSNIKIEGTEEKLDEVEASLLDHQEIIKEYVEKTEFPEHMSRNIILTMINKLREDDE